METAIYYTFSTIPQVLAGAIALFGVFVLYKIQQVNSQLIGYGVALLIESKKQAVINILGGNNLFGNNIICNERLEKAIARKDINDVKVHIDIIAYIVDKGRDLTDDKIYQASFTRIKDDFEKEDKKKSRLINWSLGCMIITCAVVIGAIGLIPFGMAMLGESRCIKPAIFIVGIIAVTACMFFIILIIYISIKEKSKTLSKKDIDSLKGELESSTGKVIKDYILHKKEGIITLLYQNQSAYSKEPELIKREIEEL